MFPEILRGVIPTAEFIKSYHYEGGDWDLFARQPFWRDYGRKVRRGVALVVIAALLAPIATRLESEAADKISKIVPPLVNVSEDDHIYTQKEQLEALNIRFIPPDVSDVAQRYLAEMLAKDLK